MANKKKRKSAAPADEQQQPKRPSSQQGRRGGGGSGAGGGGGGALAWSPEGLTATLVPGQALAFLGRARLAVQSGEVAVGGALVTPASPPVDLAADYRSGGVLLIEPGAAAGTVPLASSGPAAVLSLTAVSGGSASAASGLVRDAREGEAASGRDASAARGGQQPGFQAWLASDPFAPPAPQPLPPLWQQAAAELAATLQQQGQQQGGGGAAPAVIAVCGAKKVGKSTFARHLANSLLSWHPVVAYLDTDCGQPEFTPPGLVSLTLLASPALGPPHMHQRRPAASFFLGDVSPAGDPVRYLQYVQELYCSYCRHGAAAAAAAAGATGGGGGQAAGGGSGRQASQQQQQQQQQQYHLPPLVVNTHGWVKGMGFDVLSELLQGLPVTHLVQLASGNPNKDLPVGTFWRPEPADGGAAADNSSGAGAGNGAASQQQQQQQPVLHWLLPGLAGGEPGGGPPQPAASETSARSVATVATTGGSEVTAGAGSIAPRRLHAVEQRALQWEALAEQCVQVCAAGQAAGGGSSTSSARGAAAETAAAGGEEKEVGDRLAAAVPYEIDAADVEVQVLHSSVPASQIGYALNGSVVGLCTRPGPPPLPPQCQQQAGQSSAPAASSQQALPCLGLGIVRAADAAKGRYYVLTAVPPAELEAVEVLQLGRLELPASMLQTGAFLSPYLALHCLSTAGTGAGALKSRNNLLRSSQL